MRANIAFVCCTALILSSAISATNAQELFSAQPASFLSAESSWPTGLPHETFASQAPAATATTAGVVTEPRADVYRPVSYGSDSTSGAACQKGCQGKCHCPPFWAHRTSVFGEFLYLRPRDAEVVYATPVNAGVGANPVQVGPLAAVDPDYSPGFRAGLSWCLDECSSIVASYTHFESSTNSAINVNAPLALRSNVLHPGSLNAASDFLSANATLDVDFALVDVDYRAALLAGDQFVMNYLFGVRFAQNEQNFQSLFTNAGTTERVFTDIDFDGGGLRLGLDMERRARSRGILFYGKANASFVAGEFRSTYLQTSSTDPVVVNTALDVGRVVTMLDFELGAGWESCCGRFRVTGGYQLTTWLNTVNTDAWIQAVQANQFVDLSDNLSFDGFVARAEYRF